MILGLAVAFMLLPVLIFFAFVNYQQRLQEISAPTPNPAFASQPVQGGMSAFHPAQKANSGPTASAGTPTPTAKVEAAALNLPFQDSFLGGLAPEWKVLHGKPEFNSGSISPASSDGLTLQLGDSSLSNYTATFDLRQQNSNWQFVISTGKVMGYVNTNSTSWYAAGKNGWTLIAQNSMGGNYSGQMNLSVSGSQLNLLVNGVPVSSVSAPEQIVGPLTLILEKGGALSNFSMDH